jgi:hypothetical protein
MSRLISRGGFLVLSPWTAATVGDLMSECLLKCGAQNALGAIFLVLTSGRDDLRLKNWL